MAKACANMKPVNVASCDAHLTRNKAYMAAIPKDERYTREDLAHLNEKWNFWLDRFGDLKFTNLSVKSYYSALCQFIKDKTGRTVGRARTMRDKRGRLKEYSSVTPLWDMVVLIKDDTTKEDVTKFVRAVQGRFHITPVMAAIHRDEGHYDDDGEWKPNLHAHIVWDRIRKDGERAGRVIKLEKQDVSEIQDMAATYLGLERGVSKKISNKRHLERDELIRKKQEDKLKEVAQMDELIEQKRQEVNNLRLRESQAETRIAKLDESNGNYLLNKVASLFGKDDFDEKLAAADAARVAAETAKAEAEIAKAEAIKAKADAENERERERKSTENFLKVIFETFPIIKNALDALVRMAERIKNRKYVYTKEDFAHYQWGINFINKSNGWYNRRHGSALLASMADRCRGFLHIDKDLVVLKWHDKVYDAVYPAPKPKEEKPIEPNKSVQSALEAPKPERKVETAKHTFGLTEKEVESLSNSSAKSRPLTFSLVQPQDEEKEEEQKRGGRLHR